MAKIPRTFYLNQSDIYLLGKISEESKLSESQIMRLAISFYVMNKEKDGSFKNLVKKAKLNELIAKKEAYDEWLQYELSGLYFYKNISKRIMEYIKINNNKEEVLRFIDSCTEMFTEVFPDYEGASKLLDLRVSLEKTKDWNPLKLKIKDILDLRENEMPDKSRKKYHNTSSEF